MKWFDFFRSKRKKKKAGSLSEAAELQDLSGVDPAEIVPPESRFTQEFKDFLASQEAAAEKARAEKEAADCRECGGYEQQPDGQSGRMEECRMNALVTYFSASGVTAAVAKRLAEAIDAPLYEIRPAVPYTAEDLDWRNQQSRSSLEMKDKACRPPLADTNAPVADAEVIFLGYPVWWYREPSVIDTFLEAYDFKGRKIVLFATSGTSGIGEEAPARAAELTGAEVLPGKRFPADVSGEELKAWAQSL